MSIRNELLEMIRDKIVQFLDISAKPVPGYTNGDLVSKNALVNANGWQMIANKETSAPAEPERVGDIAYISSFVGTPAYTGNTSNENTWYVGNLFDYSDAALSFNIKAQTPDTSGDTEYALYITSGDINDPAGITLLFPFFVPTTTETIFPLEANVLVPGQTVAVILAARGVVQSNTFTANWDVKNVNGNPSEGEANFQSNQTEIRIHNIDKSDNNQSGNLSAVEVGGSLLFAGQEWTISSKTVNATFVTYGLSPAQGRPSEDERNLTFQWGSTSPLPYSEDVGFYAGTPQLSGFSGTAVGNFVTDDNLYIDFEVQELSFSDDWEYFGLIGEQLR